MEYPALTLAGLCAIACGSGIRKGSLHTILVGSTLTGVYGYSSYLLRSKANWGVELALLGSSIFLVAGLARSVPAHFRKPIPFALFVLGSLSTAYYTKIYNDMWPILSNFSGSV